MSFKTLTRPPTSWLSLLGILVALVACSSAPEPPLRVGTVLWPGHGPLFLARDLRHYPEGSIQLIEFTSTVEVIRAYRNRAIDVAGVTADEALSVAAVQPDEHRIILINDVSRGADAILARPEIGSLRELAGKRIGYEPAALGALMLARALESARLSVADVTLVAISVAEHPSAYASGRVDALVTFEPYTTLILQQGARRIFDSAQLPDEIVDVLLSRRETLVHRRAALKTLVAGWFAALEYLRREPSQAMRLMAPRYGLTPEQLRAALDKIQLADIAMNRRLLSGEEHSLAPTLQRLASVMVDHHLLQQPIDTSDLLDSRALPAP